MIVIIRVKEGEALLVDFNTQKVIAIIDDDKGLIRYLTKIFELYEAFPVKEGAKDRNCYVQIPNRQAGEETYLHRVILEYYAKYNDKLFTLLSNSQDYEVNHKNKIRLDNRIENLEIVTPQGNKLHEHNKEYENEIVMTTQEIQNIQEKLKGDKQYTSDRKYLEKASKYNLEYFKNFNNVIVYDYNYSEGVKFFKCKYLNIKFINYTSYNTINPFKLTLSKYLINLEHTIFSYIKSTNYTILYNKDLIYDKYSIIEEYNKYRYKTITTTYLTIIYKSITKTKYKPLRLVLEKYKIINISDFEDLIYCLNNIDKIEVEEETQIKVIYNTINKDENTLYNKNRLFTLIFYDLLTGAKKDIYTFNLNNILVATPIKYRFQYLTSKYKTIRAIYLLGLLKRLYTPTTSSNYINNLSFEEKQRFNHKKRYKQFDNTPNFFTIPTITTQILDEANERAKIILDLELNKITHFIVAQNFSLELADSIYKSSNSVSYYDTCNSSLQDINNTLTTYLKNKLEKEGFITIQTIKNYIFELNENRRKEMLPYNRIHDTFNSFISSCIRYIPSTKEVLKQLDVEYTTLNTKTINKILEHQTKNNVCNNQELKVYKKVIILKKLIVKNKTK